VVKHHDDIRANIVIDIFRSSNLLGRVGGRLASQTGLASVQQWILLDTISQEGEVSLKDLRQNTLVTKQNITGMVERLKQSGYVVAYEDPVDRRVTRVQLTPKGEKVLELLEPLTYESNKKTFSKFTDDELKTFASLLDRLVNDLNE